MVRKLKRVYFSPIKIVTTLIFMVITILSAGWIFFNVDPNSFFIIALFCALVSVSAVFLCSLFLKGRFLFIVGISIFFLLLLNFFDASTIVTIGLLALLIILIFRFTPDIEDEQIYKKEHQIDNSKVGKHNTDKTI